MTERCTYYLNSRLTIMTERCTYYLNSRSTILTILLSVVVNIRKLCVIYWYQPIDVWKVIVTLEMGILHYMMRIILE
jgi:hypothetical protein